MHKQHSPLRQAQQSQPRLSAATLLLFLCLGSAHGALITTPPPVVDTVAPSAIAFYDVNNVPVVVPETFSAIHPVITLDMASQIAYSVVATDKTSPSDPDPGTLFPGYPTGVIGPLAPGRNTITWKATDLGNNSFSTTQFIDVLPEVNLAVDQTVGEGNNNVTVTAYLSGSAPLYPVTLNYTVSGTAIGGVDHNAANGSIVINSPNTSGSISFKVFKDAVADPNETVIFNLTTATLQGDRVISNCTTCKNSHTVTIVETNLAPILTITATQNGGAPTHAVTSNGGLVTLSASAYDPNGDAISGYDWSASDNALVPTGGTTLSTFTFDPAGLNAGIYTARLTAKDSHGAIGTRDILLRLYATMPSLSATADSDDDSDTDSNEGIQDSDGDGIPNYLDAVSNPSWLQGWDLLTYRANLKRSDTLVSGPITFSWTLDTVASNLVFYPLLLATQPGVKLALGPVAFSNGSDHGRIDTASAALYFGSTLPGTLVSADGQVVDVEISGLSTTGQSVYLVIPQAAPLPPGSPTFKVMGAAHTWQDFVNDGNGGNNTLFAADKSADGYCPPPADSSYQPVTASSSALSSTTSCVELLVQDGGPNDYDGQANGVIRLLGAPFITVSSTNNGTITTPAAGTGPATGSEESLNKTAVTQGGGKIGAIDLWGVLGLLLAYCVRRLVKSDATKALH